MTYLLSSSASRFTILALGSSILLASACSGGTIPAGQGGQAPDPVHAAPPPPGAKHPADGDGSTTYAIRVLHLGDTDPDRTPDTVNGWKGWGFDLDGSIEAATGKNCKSRDDSSSNKTYLKGKDGIDNAFGREVLPLLLALDSSYSKKVNEGLAAGGATLLFDLEKLGAGDDYNPLEGRMYAGLALGEAPAYDSADVWPVRSDLLVNPADPGSAKVRFPGGYVTKGTWVGHADGELPLVLEVDVGGKLTILTLPIAHAVVTMDLDPGRKIAPRGVIAGVIPVSALLAQVNRVASLFSPGDCAAPTVLTIDRNLQDAADMLADGTQDPDRECDALSIGIGFEAAHVQVGTPEAPPAPVAPDCGCDAATTCAAAVTAGSGKGLCPPSAAFDAYLTLSRCACGGWGACASVCTHTLSCDLFDPTAPPECKTCLADTEGCSEELAACKAH